MKNRLTNQVEIVVGDWSGDGHGKTDTTMIKSSLSGTGIWKAYKKGIEIVGFDLTEFGSDYEDGYLPTEHYEKLLELGCTIEVDDYDPKDADEDKPEKVPLYSESYVDLFLFIVGLGDPEFRYKEADTSDSIHIGGYGLFN